MNYSSSVLKKFPKQRVSMIPVISSTLFLPINAPRAMQNANRAPLFCAQFAKLKVCPILYFLCFRDCQDKI